MAKMYIDLLTLTRFLHAIPSLQLAKPRFSQTDEGTLKARVDNTTMTVPAALMYATSFSTLPIWAPRSFTTLPIWAPRSFSTRLILASTLLIWASTRSNLPAINWRIRSNWLSWRIALCPRSAYSDLLGRFGAAPPSMCLLHNGSHGVPSSVERTMAKEYLVIVD